MYIQMYIWLDPASASCIAMGPNHKRREGLTALVLTCVWFDLSKKTMN